MKRRLRKKLRRGEFREDCFQLQFAIADGLDTQERNDSLNQFIEMVEVAGLQFGGGGGGSAYWSGFVEICGRGTMTTKQRDRVVCWLQRQPRIVSSIAGEFFDAWSDSLGSPPSEISLD